MSMFRTQRDMGISPYPFSDLASHVVLYNRGIAPDTTHLDISGVK
jgi:hypothetical protein